MHHLVEYGFHDMKTGSTTRVHITNEDDSCEENQRIKEDCRSRNWSGKYFVRIENDCSISQGPKIE